MRELLSFNLLQKHEGLSTARPARRLPAFLAGFLRVHSQELLVLRYPLLLSLICEVLLGPEEGFVLVDCPVVDPGVVPERGLGAV